MSRLNLFMKNKKNMYNEWRSASRFASPLGRRNTTSLLNPLNLFMGITSCLLPSSSCLLNFSELDLVGLTPTGGTTIRFLQINSHERLAERRRIRPVTSLDLP
jgi:hypothetical protein